MKKNQIVLELNEKAVKKIEKLTEMNLNLTFRAVVIGEQFICNGNFFKKRSTRTAELISNSRVFYFDQYENCLVGYRG
jgi:septation ring formation regulator EzrA